MTMQLLNGLEDVHAASAMDARLSCLWERHALKHAYRLKGGESVALQNALNAGTPASFRSVAHPESELRLREAFADSYRGRPWRTLG